MGRSVRGGGDSDPEINRGPRPRAEYFLDVPSLYRWNTEQQQQH